MVRSEGVASRLRTDRVYALAFQLLRGLFRATRPGAAGVPRCKNSTDILLLDSSRAAEPDDYCRALAADAAETVLRVGVPERALSGAALGGQGDTAELRRVVAETVAEGLARPRDYKAA